MEFLFDNERPIYIQISEVITLKIISNEFKPGERLPSVRDLALLAKVNPNTMQKALSYLEDIKLVTTERTNGKFVTTNLEIIKKEKEKWAHDKTLKYLQDMNILGYSKKEVIKYLEEEK